MSRVAVCRSVVAAFVLGLGLLVSAGSAAPTAVRLSVTPASGLLDAPFHVRVTGLRADASLTLKVTEPAFPGGTLTASRGVRADVSGVVALRHSRLLALVVPAAGSSADVVPRYTRKIRATVLSGRKVVAATTAVRFVTAPSVTIEEERPAATGFYGEYLRPATTSAHTAVLLIGGSTGGMPNGYAASLLASHGYPVLALAYFSAPGLPSELERIPLEYFRDALTWLAKQPEVDADRITVIGVSRGGEAALLLGSVYPDLIHGVAAYVPSASVRPSPRSYSIPAWTQAGKPVAEGPIAVEKINGPVFAVGAVQDRLWPSSAAVIAIEKRMREHGRTDVTVLNYYRAGHGAGWIVPNVPTRPTMNSRYGILDLGGNPSADAAARADSWPKLLHFLAHLR